MTLTKNAIGQEAASAQAVERGLKDTMIEITEDEKDTSY